MYGSFPFEVRTEEKTFAGYFSLRQAMYVGIGAAVAWAGFSAMRFALGPLGALLGRDFPTFFGGGVAALVLATAVALAWAPASFARAFGLPAPRERSSGPSDPTLRLDQWFYILLKWRVKPKLLIYKRAREAVDFSELL